MKRWYVTIGILAVLLIASLSMCIINSLNVTRLRDYLADTRVQMGIDSLDLTITTTRLEATQVELANTKSELNEVRSEVASAWIGLANAKAKMAAIPTSNATLLVFSKEPFIAVGENIEKAPVADLGETIVITGAGFLGDTVEIYVDEILIGSFEICYDGTFDECIDVPMTIKVPETANAYRLKVIRAKSEGSEATYPIWIGKGGDAYEE